MQVGISVTLSEVVLIMVNEEVLSLNLIDLRGFVEASYEARYDKEVWRLIPSSFLAYV